MLGLGTLWHYYRARLRTQGPQELLALAGIATGVALIFAVQVALGVLAPITAPAVAALFWTSARTRVIRWRHIEYEVLGPEAVRVLRRHTPGAAA